MANDKKIFTLDNSMPFDIKIFLSLTIFFVWFFVWNIGVCCAAEDDGSIDLDLSEVTATDLSDAPDLDGSTQEIVNLIVQNLITQPQQSSELEEPAIQILSMSASESDLQHIPDKNVIIFQGSFNNNVGYFIFPADAASRLWISTNNVLHNVSSSNVTGRFFLTDTYSDQDYNYIAINLLPILAGSTAQQIYNNSYSSYATYYSVSGGRLTTTNVYGNFIVAQSIDADIDSLDYYSFCVLIIICAFVALLFIREFMSLRGSR